MRVIVHGGAGGTAEDPEARQQALDAAAGRGSDESDAVSGAVAAAAALESAPRFNAGVGSVVQSDGEIRTDAGLMTGRGTGGACSMTGVEHAAEVARLVAVETPHVLLAGERAVEFAAGFGVATDRDLWTDRTRERWANLDPPEGRDPRDHLAWVRERFGGTDTVGAVAAADGDLAAVTSTGGRWCALPGRVGDVPQVGAGFYATETAAASATGAGEAIARFGLARRTVRLASEHPPQLAADRAIDAFERATGEQAGVILLNAAGRTGRAYNSAEMLTAVRG